MAARGNNTEAVRQFAAAQGIVRRKQVADALGLTIEQARGSIETLVAQGRLKRIGHGSYEFQEARESRREAPIEERIWHAMRINPTFAASDIALQAGTTTSYFYKRMREYRAEGYVRPAGQRPLPGGGSERLWRLGMKGRELLDRPKVEEFHPDPVVLAVVKLNRLVCTGMAMRYEDACREAVKISCEIAGMLENRREERERETR